MAKSKVSGSQNLTQLEEEASFARSIRKASFADTCAAIEKWTIDAKSKYLNGRSPTPQSVAYLVRLVQELSTGSHETKILTFSVEDIAGVTGLEKSSLTARIKEWGEPVVCQAGRRKARFDLMSNLKTLKRQFPDVDSDDWNALIIKSASL